MPVPVDEPIPTPDGDTLVIALPTAPPIQLSFSRLLAENPDTVGFLEIGEMLSLPVVQRPNDNEYYLDHSFEGAKALEGTLFLDGMNRLAPEDDCLIVYGHNMKNRTMFGRLSAYGDVSHLRQHPVVHFDTIYENRSYVAFAAFSASMKPGDVHYFDVRNFVFDEAGLTNCAEAAGPVGVQVPRGRALRRPPAAAGDLRLLQPRGPLHTGPAPAARGRERGKHVRAGAADRGEVNITPTRRGRF